jgi:GT2 family glycosyltransferase
MSRVELIHRNSPSGFATNVNLVIREAAAMKCDVVFLNNDVIFTSRWLDPLCVNQRAILVPACNQNFPYQYGPLSLRPTMSWEDYAGHENDLENLAVVHRKDRRFAGVLWRAPRISFFCFRLPFEVYESVGLFDEGFGHGGGEDIDYRLRTHLAGFDVAIALDSYVLHFMGKSTWDSGEAEKSTRAREATYIEHFRSKWGNELAQMFLFGKDSEAYTAMLGVDRMIASGDYLSVIKYCQARRQ